MNLALIQELHREFDKSTMLNESYRQLKTIDFDDIIRGNPSEAMREFALKSTIQNKLGANYHTYLNLQVNTDVIMLFIDMCSFSTRFGSLSNSQLSVLLDQYYAKVIPVIYKYGGEIDKIIGDGIICLFGQPFLNLSGNSLFSRAEDCAKELISITKGTNFKSKIALHDGTVMYYRNKQVQYPEYTIIGKPITELHRLESISEDEKINFYNSTSYYNYTNNKNHIAPWYLSGLKTIAPALKGVSFGYRKCLEKQ